MNVFQRRVLQTAEILSRRRYIGNSLQPRGEIGGGCCLNEGSVELQQPVVLSCALITRYRIVHRHPRPALFIQRGHRTVELGAQRVQLIGGFRVLLRRLYAGH